MPRIRRPIMTDPELYTWMTTEPQVSIVQRGLSTPCWEWTGQKLPNKCNYGRIAYKAKMRVAHRLVWYFIKGKWPVLQINHHCDNPPCINPEHLFEGTQQQNIDDMVSKGRQCRGEINHNAKLIEQQVISIRIYAKYEIYTTKHLAKMFGVQPQTVQKIVNKSIWKYL